MEVPLRIAVVPQNLSLRNAINFCNLLWRMESSPKIIVDCSKMKHVEPFTIAYVSAEIKRYIEAHPDIRVDFQGYEKITYAALMGFFRAAGVDYGNEPGQARGNANYIPLTILRTNDIQRTAVDSYEPVGNIVEREAEKLARMLTRSEDGELVDVLTYSLREIMRNVVEHSQSEVLEFCAQYWPTKHLVQMAVLDYGIGVRTSLSKNPYLAIGSDRDAVHLALLPGISGKMFKGVKRDKSDVWQNSGFGLYMINRICRNGGSFFLCSGQSGILLSDQGKIDIKTSFPGTALRVVIDTQRLDGLSKSLDQYRREGFEFAKRYKDGPVEPSIASTMLFKDFDVQ